jgi:hypothetical protein
MKSNELKVGDIVYHHSYNRGVVRYINNTKVYNKPNVIVEFEHPGFGLWDCKGLIESANGRIFFYESVDLCVGKSCESIECLKISTTSFAAALSSLERILYDL